MLDGCRVTCVLLPGFLFSRIGVEAEDWHGMVWIGIVKGMTID